MRSDGNLIFIGMEINDKLQDQLDASKTSVKPYFKDNNPEFLQVMQIDNNDYIGKFTRSGSSLENLSNILLNVKTMLKMICPKFFFSDSAITIMALSTISSRTIY